MLLYLRRFFLFKKFTSDFPLKSSNKLPKMQSKYNIFIPDLMTKTSQTDTPKICLKNMQTAFVSYVFYLLYICIISQVIKNN